MMTVNRGYFPEKPGAKVDGLFDPAIFLFEKEPTHFSWEAKAIKMENIREENESAILFTDESRIVRSHLRQTRREIHGETL
jgi:hypothetical protein